MKRLWIIFLIALIWAAFSKIEGTFMQYNLFPFSSWKMSYPIYAWNICLNLVPAAYMWTLVSQEKEKPYEMKLAAWIVTGKLFDFVLECNKGWIRVPIEGVGVYPISYDTLMFILLGLVVLKATLNE